MPASEASPRICARRDVVGAVLLFTLQFTAHAGNIEVEIKEPIDTVTYSDVLTALRTAFLTLADTITYTDTLIKQAVKALLETITFTDTLIRDLLSRGVDLAYLTLHVGIGTFRTVKVDDLTQHQMHAETYEIPEGTAIQINRL